MARTHLRSSKLNTFLIYQLFAVFVTSNEDDSPKIILSNGLTVVGTYDNEYHEAGNMYNYFTETLGLDKNSESVNFYSSSVSTYAGSS